MHKQTCLNVQKLNRHVTLTGGKARGAGALDEEEFGVMPDIWLPVRLNHIYQYSQNKHGGKLQYP